MVLSPDFPVLEFPPYILRGYHCIMDLLDRTLFKILDDRCKDVVISPGSLYAVLTAVKSLVIMECRAFIVCLIKDILIKVSLMLGVKGIYTSPPLFYCKIAELLVADETIAIFINDGEDLQCLVVSHFQS